MNETAVKALCVCAVCALTLGPFLVRSSLRHEAVYGGPLAHLFHAAGALLLMSALPGVIAALVFGGGFRTALPLGAALLALSYAALLLFAIVEQPARKRHQQDEDEHGWTAEKARTSGL